MGGPSRSPFPPPPPPPLSLSLSHSHSLSYPLCDSEFTGLHLAAANGQLAAATWLLANGADPNQASSHGVLPLACALASRSTAIVQALLAAGATVPTKGTKMLHAEESNQRYETATVIQWSLSRGRTRELKLLLNAAGAAAWSKDALIGPAVRSGHCESVAAALSAGVARGDEIVATEEKDEATMKMKPHHRKRRGRFPSEAPALTVASALGECEECEGLSVLFFLPPLFVSLFSGYDENFTGLVRLIWRPARLCNGSLARWGRCETTMTS